MKLQPDTTPEQVKRMKRLRMGDEASEERREYLEKLAVIHTKEDIHVRIRGKKSFVNLSDEDVDGVPPEKTYINIHEDVPSQSETDFEDRIWSIMFQKAALYHEIGHVLFTDWPSFEANMGAVDKINKSMYKRFWNILEDACVEKAVGKRYQVKNDLKIMRANFLADQSISRNPSMTEAIGAKLMEFTHPIGWVDEILDNSDIAGTLMREDHILFENEVIPFIDDNAPEIIEETEPVERNKKYHEFFKGLIEFIDQSKKPGRTDDVEWMDGSDAEENDGSHGKSISIEISEEDTEDEESISEEEMEEISEEYHQEILKGGDSEGETPEESMMNWLEAVKENSDKNLELDVVEKEPKDFDSESCREAERMSKVFERDLQQYLRRERKSKKRKKRRVGRFDPRSVHKTKKGKTNVFTQNINPEEKEYSVVLILDRSGSMNNALGRDLITESQKTAAATTFALEAVGIDCCQISVLDREAKLEKDFTETTQEAKRKMFCGKTNGGTPLTESLAIARDRVEASDKLPFIVIITDGKPDKHSMYREELRACNVPVLGLYVTMNGSIPSGGKGDHSYFHRLEFRNRSSSFDGVRNLIKTAMF